MTNVLNAVANANTVDINTVIGPICNAHPNVCLCVNNIISHEPENVSLAIFRDYEFLKVCKKWCDMPTEIKPRDLSDTYWIMKCWLKLDQHYYDLYKIEGQTSSHLRKCCNSLIDSIPNLDISEEIELYDISTIEFTTMITKQLIKNIINEMNNFH